MKRTPAAARNYLYRGVAKAGCEDDEDCDTGMAKEPVIPSRAELAEMVAEALDRTRALAAEDPASKLPPLIQPQLEFIAQHLEEGSPPAYADRQRINIGQIAARNYEDVDPEYARWLELLNYAVRRWEQIPGVPAAPS